MQVELLKKKPEGFLKTYIYSMEDNIMFVATLQYLQQPPLTLIVEEG